MKKDKKGLYQKAKEAIMSNNLFFVEDIASFIPCSKQTLYDNFPVESDEMDELKRMLDDNRIKTKTAIRSKLYRMENNPTALIVFYKMIATKEEREAIGTRTDITSNGKGITNPSPIVLDSATKEDRDRLMEKLNGDDKGV